MRRRTLRLGRALPAAVAAALVLGCEQAQPAAVLEEAVFLLNLEPERVALDGAPGLDLARPGTRRVTRAALALGFSTRKCLWQARGSEVVFRDVLEEGARVRFEVGFGIPSEGAPQERPGRPFSLELLARSTSGEQRLLWSEELVPPAPGAQGTWKPVECALPFASGDLVLRMGGASEKSIAPGAPGWASPRIVPAQPRSLSGPARRNVIVFLVDTLRADRIGPLGHRAGSTPTLDALADEALVFTQANAAAPWTKASVASLMTSRYPSRHGAEGFPDRLRDSHLTLARVFGEAGYATAAVGFNTWVFNPQFNLGSGFQEVLEVFDQEREGGARADTVVAEAVDWILRRGERPFFLYVHTIDPHEPYAPSAEDRARFVPAYDGPLTGRLVGPGTHATRRKADVTRKDMEYLQALYDAEIAFADRMLGLLVQRLRELGLWDETTLVFTADHGEEFLEHGGWSHGGTLYQELLHVPLLIKPPASADLAPRVREDPVSLLDVAPTVLELAGIGSEGLPFRGQSLLSYGDGVRRRMPILAELHKEGQHALSVRDGDLKYIQVLEPDEHEELYDLASDPGETRNLLELADPEQLAALRQLVATHRAGAPRRGLYVEVLGDGTPAVVQVRVESPDTGLDHNLIECERAVDSIAASEAARGRVITARLTLDAKDRRDVVFLDPAPGTRIELFFKLDDAPMAPSRILVGPARRPALNARLKLRADAPELLAEGEPELFADEEPEPPAEGAGIWCRVWQLRPPEEAGVEFDPAMLESLRALGYVK